MSKLLLIHGGGPTAVINASLYGAIIEAKKSDKIDKIFASKRGVYGIWENQYIDLTNVSDDKLELLKSTPGSAIGTGRDHLEDSDYDKLAKILNDKGFDYVLMAGGNGTQDTARKLSISCKPYNILVGGIPKTMDNDLSKTDHSPGFPSAARYLAGSVKEVAQDVKGLSIHVVVIEAFGRDAGWIAASSALAREKEGDAPHMILCPEFPFDEEKFLKRVKELYEELGGVVVVASEGLRYKDGTPIVEPVFQIERSTYYGDVSSHLANLITKKLHIKSRSEKPGILGRASAAWISDIDRDEAVECGKKAVELVLDGKTAYVPVIERISSYPYESKVVGVEIDDSILDAKTMPKEYLDNENYNVTKEYIEWLKPLVKPELPEFVSFLDDKENV
ncbi:MAG: diphosphate--fructose-6-phosphate 1-phosphotransferase [Pleomorphochaeta sp.]